MAGLVKGRTRRRELFRETLLHLVVGGVGGCLPVAVFVVTGQVTGQSGGSTAVVALVVASVAAFLTGLCFAEFKTFQATHSSRHHLYSCFHDVCGETPAFLVGWSLLLHQMTTLASSAKIVSGAIDYVSGKKVRQFFLDSFGVLPLTQEPPDLLSMGLVLLSMTALVAIGQGSAVQWLPCVSSLVTVSATLLFVSIGPVYTDYSDWNMQAILPQDFIKVLSGTAICTSAYSSHFLLSTPGRCLWRSRPALPVAFGVSILFTLLTCFGVALILTLMVHYRVLSCGVALIEAFEVRDVNWARFVMVAATIVCVSTTILDISDYICRTVHSMAQDGLLFRFLSNGWESPGVSVASAVLSGSVTSLFALLVSLTGLLQMMATGCIIVSISASLWVLWWRYQPIDDGWRYEALSTTKSEVNLDNSAQEDSSLANGHCSSNESCSPINNNNKTVYQSVPLHVPSDEPFDTETDSDSSDTDIDAIVEEYKEKLRVATLTHIAHSPGDDGQTGRAEPTLASGRCVTLSVLGLCVVFLLLGVSAVVAANRDIPPVLKAGAAVLGLLAVVLLAVISRQPQVSNVKRGEFRVPYLPWTPAVAVLVHLCLLVHLVQQMWVWVSVWLTAGTLLYVGYSILYGSMRSARHQSVDREQIQLRPLPRAPLVSTVVPSHSKNRDNKRRLTEVDTILISR